MNAPKAWEKLETVKIIISSSITSVNDEKAIIPFNYLNSSSSNLLKTTTKTSVMNEYKMDMKTAVIFGGTDFISLIFNFYFHYLIYRMTLRKDLKKSQGTITNVLACYSVITPITFLFAFIYLNIILQYTSPPSEIIGEWFCFVYEYYVHVVCIYLATFSLFTALMKYWFIVENARATNFGVEKGIFDYFADLVFHLYIHVCSYICIMCI